jgi:hypothetical protein
MHPFEKKPIIRKNMKLDAYFKAKFSLSLEEEKHLEPIIQV